MINFNAINLKTFLTDYWQKKPLVIRNALPNFINPLSPDELAGLSLEEDLESRLIWETPQETPRWHLKRGPFVEKDFKSLSETHWTLLVQGVDRVVPDVEALLSHFDFIPQWRFDDIMISYAPLHGSVGPHFDNYDVFLYQAMGKREWSLTTKNCTAQNYVPDLELRIMNEFQVEEAFILEEGDMLYLPPHIGHYGIAVSNECITYSFGYRSYQGQEIWDSLGDYLSEKGLYKTLYKDPNWSCLKNNSEIPDSAWQNARQLLQEIINDEKILKQWFGCFSTRLDQNAEHQLSIALEEDHLHLIDPSHFIEELKNAQQLVRDPNCRFAYYTMENKTIIHFYINGCKWNTAKVSPSLLFLIANNRAISSKELKPYLNNSANQHFLFDLYKLQWLKMY